MLKKLEAILFVEGGRVSRKKIKTLLGVSLEETENLIQELKREREDKGIILIDDGEYIELVTNPELKDFVEDLKKVENISPLSQAANETLAIISYTGPISKSDLDFLRGVNTQFTIRRLMIRGLIKETRKERGARFFTVTTDFMKNMGITELNQLKDYNSIREKILNDLRAIKERME